MIRQTLDEKSQKFVVKCFFRLAWWSWTVDGQFYLQDMSRFVITTALNFTSIISSLSADRSPWSG